MSAFYRYANYLAVPAKRPASRPCGNRAAAGSQPACADQTPGIELKIDASGIDFKFVGRRHHAIDQGFDLEVADAQR